MKRVLLAVFTLLSSCFCEFELGLTVPVGEFSDYVDYGYKAELNIECLGLQVEKNELNFYAGSSFFLYPQDMSIENAESNPGNMTLKGFLYLMPKFEHEKFSLFTKIGAVVARLGDVEFKDTPDFISLNTKYNNSFAAGFAIGGSYNLNRNAALNIAYQHCKIKFDGHCSGTLKNFPYFDTEFDCEAEIIMRSVNIGFAYRF